MLSSRMYRIIALLNIFQRFGATTLTFDHKLLRFDIVSSEDKDGAKVSKQVKLNYFLLIAWLLLSFFILCRKITHNGLDHNYFTLMFWFGMLISAVLVSMIFWFSSEIRVNANGILVYFDPESSKINLIIDGIVCFISASVILSYFCFFLLCCWNPSKSLFLAQLFIPAKYCNFVTALPITLLHGYLCIFIAINISLVGGMAQVYPFYTTVLVTRELRLDHGRERFRLCPFNDLCTAFRSFQVIHAIVMSKCGIIIFLGQWAMMGISVFINFVLIRYWGTLNLLSRTTLVTGSMVTCLSWSSLLELGSYMFVQGGKVIWSWRSFQSKPWKLKSELEGKWMKKFAKSCAPIVYCYGKTFVVKRDTILNYHRSVTWGIFRALLTL